MTSPTHALILAAALAMTAGTARATSTTFTYVGTALTNKSCPAGVRCPFTRIRATITVPGSFAGGEAVISDTASAGALAPTAFAYSDGVTSLAALPPGLRLACLLMVSKLGRVHSADCSFFDATGTTGLGAAFGSDGTPDQAQVTRGGASLSAISPTVRDPGRGWRVTVTAPSARPASPLAHGLHP